MWKDVQKQGKLNRYGSEETVTNVLWQTVLGEIEVSVSRASFATWFKNTDLIQNDNGHLVVAVPNIFAKRQLEDKFNKVIVEILSKNKVEVKNIEYKITSGVEKVSTKTPTEPATAVASQAPAVKDSRTTSSGHPNLNVKYTFDNFVVGASNELAYAACQAVAKNPGTRYNPLFIYGGVGLGKTHLIQAVGNRVLEANPRARVEYVTSENFTGEFITSILSKKSFTKKFRTADVLIIDDMQFIAGKEKTQEEFFHTFNALQQANKQIIISSDQPPKAIPTLEDRLRSRFEQGMTADISPPDFETRCAIIQTKANQHHLFLTNEIIEYIASHVQSNIRELEGTLTKIIVHCEMRDCEPNLEIVQQLVEPANNSSKHITSTQIVNKTADHFGLSLEEITSAKRNKEISEPRQIAMYLMRSELHLSFPQIAKAVGRKDHTTAIHSVNKIEQALNRNHYIREQVYKIKEDLYV